MTLLDLLKADASRQLHFAGAEDTNVSAWRLARMLVAPRFVPVVLYRFSHACAKNRLRAIGKLLSLVNFVVFGLEIGIDCPIGPGLYLPHTSGTVIGARRVGANAVIYHNVTLGAKELDLVYDPARRPELGDDVLVASGAKILGGVVVGSGAVIAANAVVLQDVPPRALAGGVPARVLRQP
jgi:serine O-acetyltransferase